MKQPGVLRAELLACGQAREEILYPDDLAAGFWLGNALRGLIRVVLRPATEEDYFTEYLAPIISVKVVTGIDEAIAHINHYSSKHTEAIVTDNHPKAAPKGRDSSFSIGTCLIVFSWRR